jgi:transposase
MMGQHELQDDLFCCSGDLASRIPDDHILKQLDKVDFSFVREEVKHLYGTKGNTSVDPVIIMKMMLMLVLDDVPSERELVKIIRYRIDYLWFLGYSMDATIPNHSVLSKARARWGADIFESLFIRTIQLCAENGLIDGSKVHVDGSLIAANASTNSVFSTEQLRLIYNAQAKKLDEEDDDDQDNYTDSGRKRRANTLQSSTDRMRLSLENTETAAARPIRTTGLLMMHLE